MSTLLLTRIDTTTQANNLPASTGDHPRIFIRDLFRFYKPIFNPNLSADGVDVIPALETEWYWVNAAVYDVKRALEYIPRETNGTDIIWDVDKSHIAAITMETEGDAEIQITGTAAQGEYHYIAISPDPVSDYTLTFEAGKFMDQNGDLLTTYTVLAGKGVILPFVAITTTLFQVPKHL